jgi:MoxR-like ATPase
MENQEIFKNRIDLSDLNTAANAVREEIGKVIVGQKQFIDLLLVAILADGHALIEGVPGVAKTLTARLLAKAISTGFSRIQFTPDLMPSDVVGTSVFNLNKSEFEFKAGPVFSNIILIDEINRAPAKTQSALFEVMQERQVTVDGKTYEMNKPFLVFATQNPVEHEGTYRLPEAQLDRFLFKITVNYPSLEEEEQILAVNHHLHGKAELENIKPVLKAKQILEYQGKVRQVQADDNLRKYIAMIIHKTRNNSDLYLGASPRAGVNLLIASKAYAAIQGRDYITPEDILEMVGPVLCHRILLTPEKEMEGSTAEAVIKGIVHNLEIPR